MAFNYSPKIVTDGLVLALDAANPNSYVSGSTSWRDISRGGNNGTLTNGPTYNSANGGSIVFDGTNDYVNCGSGSILNLSNLTLNSWVKPNTISGLRNIIAYELCYKVRFNDSNINLLVGDGTSWHTFGYTSSPSIINNNWYNVAVTIRSGINYNIYLNGVSILTSSCGGVGTNSRKLFVGAYATALDVPGEIFNGSISSAQLYNRSLSAAEITQNYNATKGRYGL